MDLVGDLAQNIGVLWWDGFTRGQGKRGFGDRQYRQLLAEVLLRQETGDRAKRLWFSVGQL